MAKSKKKTKKKTETPKLRIPQKEFDKLAGSLSIDKDTPDWKEIREEIYNNRYNDRKSKNKSSEQLREFVHSFLLDKQEDVLNAFDELTAKEKVKFYSALLQYSLPKLKHVKIQEISKEK